MALVLAVSGCSARADVAVTEASPAGSGTVAVTVTLDASADATIGGLASVVDTAGLAGEGWQVAPVRAVPGGGSSIAASHRFASAGELQVVLDEVAGPHRLELALGGTHGLLRSTVTARGAIDLTCGVACFGDAGLKAATGSVVGVEPSTPVPGSLQLDLSLVLPGASHPGRPEVWAGRLGSVVPIRAQATVSDRTDTAVAAAGAVVALVAATVAVVLVRRRRRGVRSGVAPPA